MTESPKSRRVRPLVAIVAIGAVAAIVAGAAYVGGVWPGHGQAGVAANSSPCPSSPNSTPSSSVTDDRVSVRWLVTCGSELVTTLDIDAEQAVVNKYNASQTETRLKIEDRPASQSLRCP